MDSARLYEYPQNSASIQQNRNEVGFCDSSQLRWSQQQEDVDKEAIVTNWNGQGGATERIM